MSVHELHASEVIISHHCAIESYKLRPNQVSINIPQSERSLFAEKITALQTKIKKNPNPILHTNIKLTRNSNKKEIALVLSYFNIILKFTTKQQPF